MSLEGVYDPENIFAKIARGEIPSVKVFEDANVMAIMDAYPQARGHVLVLHKRAVARNLLDVGKGPFNHLMPLLQRVAKAQRVALGPDGIVLKQFNGAAAGQSIFHLHFHLIPVYEGEQPGAHGQTAADPAELADLAAQIAACLPAEAV